MTCQALEAYQSHEPSGTESVQTSQLSLFWSETHSFGANLDHSFTPMPSFLTPVLLFLTPCGFFRTFMIVDIRIGVK